VFVGAGVVGGGEVVCGDGVAGAGVLGRGVSVREGVGCAKVVRAVGGGDDDGDADALALGEDESFVVSPGDASVTERTLGTRRAASKSGR
jgi:hypothetical protein